MYVHMAVLETLCLIQFLHAGVHVTDCAVRGMLTLGYKHENSDDKQ
jgi:hypothetical protein